MGWYETKKNAKMKLVLDFHSGIQLSFAVHKILASGNNLQETL